MKLHNEATEAMLMEVTMTKILFCCLSLWHVQLRCNKNTKVQSEILFLKHIHGIQIKKRIILEALHPLANSSQSQALLFS